MLPLRKLLRTKTCHCGTDTEGLSSFPVEELFRSLMLVAEPEPASGDLLVMSQVRLSFSISASERIVPHLQEILSSFYCKMVQATGFEPANPRRSD